MRQFNAATVCLVLCLGLLGPAVSSHAQAPAPPAPAADEDDEDDDAVLNPAEPDFVIVNLPTTMRLPVRKGSFRLTHRFAGNLRNGSFGELAGNLFGIDQGAIIGFEYRMGVLPGVEAAFYRSSFDKTIQFHGKYDAIRQRSSGMPVSISAVVSIEGTDNFQEKYAPAVGLSIGRTVAGRFAAYLVPVWVNNTAASLDAIAHDHDHGAEGDAAAPETAHDHRRTVFLGAGGRLRVSRTVYVVGEVTPRLRGYAPDQMEYGVGLEARVGSHMFSLTFTNTFGTTYAQLARGGAANTLYLGFNLARKFF